MLKIIFCVVMAIFIVKFIEGCFELVAIYFEHDGIKAGFIALATCIFMGGCLAAIFIV